MSATHVSAGWLYWEMGLLASLAALAVTPPEQVTYGAYGIVTVLFAWGLVRGHR